MKLSQISSIRKSTPITALAVLSASLLTTHLEGATTAIATGTSVNNSVSTFNADSSGGVGRNAPNTFDNRAGMVFRVSDILANESLVLADLATTSFSFSFDTANANIALADTGSYTVEYIGFYANSNFPASGVFGGLTTSDWTGPGKFGTAAMQTIDTGVADSLAQQLGITASGFILTGVTEADSANDVVLFRIRYDEPQAPGPQLLSNYTLTVVPEPSGAVLIALGGLALLLRRGRF